MESIFLSLCEMADQAYWIFFLALMLAGLNLPLSEDLILLTGGALASTCIPEHALHLYLWIYFGCWISAWEAYAIGRYLGPKLYRIKWFHRFVYPERVERIHYYYEKFGVFTFIVGRFIPGGVRNALFLSSGLGKMPFIKFILRDGFACLISSSILFSIGYQFGKNYSLIIYYFDIYKYVGLAIVILIITSLLIYHSKRRKINRKNDI